MKRTPTVLFALALLASASPALAQDDWDDDDGVISADEFDAPDDDDRPSSTNQGAPLGLAPAEWGIGFRRSLSGNLGPELEYWMSDKLLITGGLALGYRDPPGDATDSQIIFIVSGGAFYNLISGDRAALLGGGRLVVGVNSAGGIDTNTGESEGLFQFNIELPVRTEVFLSDLFSIHFETGVAISFVGEDGPVLPPYDPLTPGGGLPRKQDSLNVSIGGTAGLFGAAGVTLYWP